MSRGISLLDYGKESNRAYLLEEFSKNNIVEPKELTKSSKDKVLWICEKYGYNHEYDMSVSDRVYKNCHCPYCAGNRTLVGFNDLWTTNPTVAELLEIKDIGYQLTEFSTKRTNFICSECEFIIKNKPITEISRQGLACPQCGDKRRYPEKLMTNVLNQLNLNFKTQNKFKWSNSYYDFYIPSFSMIIETHGRQHFEEGCFETLGGNTLQEEQKNDKYKYEMAMENGIENYVVIDCRYSEIEWIKNSILESVLSQYFDMSNIDWVDCDLKASKSSVKQIAELWNNGVKNTQDIMKIVGLGKSSVNNYLRKADKLGLCKYSPYETRSRTVVMRDLDNNILGEFSSAEEASKILNISTTMIRYVCYGKYKTTKGFKFEFKNEKRGE